MFANNKTQINFKYIRTSYGIALVWISAIVIPVLLAEYNGADVDSYGAVYYMIFSGVIFPFARIAYDIPIGFKLNDKVGRIGMATVEGFLLFMYLLVLIFSVFLAPFGFLYLIVKGLQSHEQMFEKLDQERQEKEELKKEMTALREEVARQEKTHSEI